MEIKKIIFQKAIGGIVFGIFAFLIIFLGIYLTKARTGTTATPGDKLTASKWNELVNKINTLNIQDYPQGTLTAGTTSTEQDTGKKWIDGKEMYRKIISMGSLSDTGTTARLKVNHGIIGVNDFVSIEGIMKYPGASGSWVTLGGFPNNSVGTEIYCNQTQCIIEYIGARASRTSSFIIVEYTKS